MASITIKSSSFTTNGDTITINYETDVTLTKVELTKDSANWISTTSYTQSSAVFNISSWENGTYSSCKLRVTYKDTDKYGNIVLSNTTITLDGGASKTITVKLDSAPTNNQTVKLSRSNIYCYLDNSVLTFTPDNYNKPQTVKITGVQDSNHYEDKTSIITVSSPNVKSKMIEVTIKNIDFTDKTITPALTLDKNIDENTGTVFDDNSGNKYVTESLIQVKPSSEYTITINSSSWLDVYEYDNNGKFIQYTNLRQINVTNYSHEYTTPSNCGYIRVFTLSPNATPILSISGLLSGSSGGDDNYEPTIITLIANDKSAAASNKSIIENALNSAGSGGTVRLPVGTYYVSVGLNIPANVTLEGKSAKETILQLHSPSDRYYVASTVGGNTTLKNFTYKDDVTNNQQPSTTDTTHKDNNQALLMVTGNNVTFDNCGFYNSSTWLVACDDTGSSSNQHNNFVMKNCYNKWCKRSYYTTPFDISQVYVVCEKMTFTNNTFETDAPAFSRTVFDVRGFHITMTGNKIYNFVQPALLGNASFNARTAGMTQKHIITDNTFIGVKVGTMIYSYTSGYDAGATLNHHYSHLEYKRNTVEVNTDVLGIGVDNNQGQSIAGIVCYGGNPNEYEGITISDNTFNCASPNTVKTHASLITGIGLYNGSTLNIHDVNITGNTIKNFPYTGLIVGHQASIGGSTSNIKITGNKFLNNARNTSEVWPYSSHLTIMDANINGLTITGNDFTSDGTTIKAKYAVAKLGYNSNVSNITVSNNTGNCSNNF